MTLLEQWGREGFPVRPLADSHLIRRRRQGRPARRPTACCGPEDHDGSRLLAAHAAVEDLAIPHQPGQHPQIRAVRWLVGDRERRRTEEGRHERRLGARQPAEPEELDRRAPRRRHAHPPQRDLVAEAGPAVGANAALHEAGRELALRRIPVLGPVGAQGVLHPNREPRGRDVEAVLLDEVGPQTRPAVVGGGGPPDEDHLRYLEQVAHVADPVTVDVTLVGVGIGRAVVAGVPEAVIVQVVLVGIADQRAVVAGVTQAIAVGILLTGVSHVGAVVAGVEDPVAVAVRGRTDARPPLADVRRGTLVAVVAGRGVVRVDAGARRTAAVVGAGVRVGAVLEWARLAGAAGAHVADRTGVAIVARRGVVRVRAGAAGAAVVGAGVVVVAGGPCTLARAAGAHVVDRTGVAIVARRRVGREDALPGR